MSRRIGFGACWAGSKCKTQMIDLLESKRVQELLKRAFAS
jgi:hypothetical protein